MKTLNVTNVNEALYRGILLMTGQDAHVKKSRVGEVIEYNHPVVTTYSRPWERMLFSPVRNANPFFHIMEAFWILAGREDVASLVEYNSRMGEFSDNGETFHAAYGQRLRMNGGLDQLKQLIALLKQNKHERRAVATIWDPVLDCGADSKDIPCNDLLDFKIVHDKLNLTVYCRSNDMLWGAYGANAVQFSVIHQYMAEMIGVELGVYNQISSSFHIYLDGPGGALWDKLQAIDPGTLLFNPYTLNQGIAKTPIVDNPKTFEEDLLAFWKWHDNYAGLPSLMDNSIFEQVLAPLVTAWKYYKHEGDIQLALDIVKLIKQEDIRIACDRWLTNVMFNRNKKGE